MAQGLPLDELHRHKMHGAGLSLDLPDLVNGQNIRMARSARRAGLLFETTDAFGVLRESRGQQFERDAASEIQILRKVDLSHPARAELGKDSVMRDCFRSHATLQIQCPTRYLIRVKG